jgi:CRP/FNR family transcriptional regulator, cyclic AMP receptor protein
MTELIDETAELVAALRALDDLADCDHDELAELAAHCTTVNVPPGWAFIVEGMPGDACFIVVGGEVRVTQLGEEIARVGAGELVGEIALLEERPRTATCVAETQVQLLELDGSEFNGWLQQRPHVRDRLVALARGRPRR